MQQIKGLKYQWRVAAGDMHEITTLAARCNMPVALIEVLYNRGFTTYEQIFAFIISSQEKDVAHPKLLKDAEKAVDRIIQAINLGEKILIAGDYDVDGITSAALMMVCLLHVGAQVNFFLPHRVKDGYGLSVKTIELAHANNYRIVITVDNGISAFAAGEKARELGIDLIITDHHKPHDHLPPAFAVIDPHQSDCAYPYKTFAGVGVSFKIMSLLYEKLGREIPAEVYELLLLGTVADVVPLTGENRYWVRYGLQKLTKGHSYSLSVLKRNARVTKPTLSSRDIGFFITPQINALGRLEDARSGVKFLVGSDEQETETVGALLHELNETRKRIERQVFQDVDAQIASGSIDPYADRVIIAASENWPPGVIGLVAGKLASAYGVPAILLHKTPQGVYKGSCRSIPECNVFNALTSVHDLLVGFGGHPMAAGLSIREEKFDLFKQRIKEYMYSVLKPEDLVKKIKIDAQLLLTDMNAHLMQSFAHLEPFGCENSQPLFYIKNVSLIETPQLLKEQHTKARVFCDGVIKPVMFFNRPDIFTWLQQRGSEPFDIAAHVEENHWNGRVTLELQGIDIAVSH